MGRADIGSAKYASKQMKLSGLQKTSYYCQICSKQCRDLNGFKNHKLSPSHLGKLEGMMDSKDSRTIVGEFSAQFERDFLGLLRRGHGTKWINANKFYQEYIQDRHHVHLNSTKWMSLTSFIKYLGKKGIVKVQEDDEFLLIRLGENEVVEKEVEEKDGMETLISKQIELGKINIKEEVKDEEKEEKELPKQPIAIKLNIKKPKVIKSVFSDSE